MHSEKMEGACGPKRARAKKNGWFYVNPYLVAGVVGASFCFAWFFSILLTPDFLSSGMADPAVLGLLHLAFAIARRRVRGRVAFFERTPDASGRSSGSVVGLLHRQ